MAIDDNTLTALAGALRTGQAIPTSLRDMVVWHFGEATAASGKYTDDADLMAGSATARVMLDPAMADALRARKAPIAQQIRNNLTADTIGATPAPSYESPIDTPALRSRGLLGLAMTPWRAK